MELTEKEKRKIEEEEKYRQAVAISSSQTKNKTLTTLLAIFLGGFGIHKFYLGRVGWGIVYLIFSWTWIPMILGIIEGIIYLCTSEEEFNKKYS